ncbi:hypothetical protein CVV72_08155 [Amycolatopsis sp. TNS106]|nr:hypothetical protein CVV72_08155 [Amycolatopsis sp. TNS106]
MDRGSDTPTMVGKVFGKGSSRVETNTVRTRAGQVGVIASSLPLTSTFSTSGAVHDGGRDP